MRAAAEKMPDFAVTLRFPRKTLSNMPGTASGTVQIVRARLVNPEVKASDVFLLGLQVKASHSFGLHPT